MTLSAYLAPDGFEDDLAAELGDSVCARYDRLFLTEEPARDVVWAENTWRDPRFIEISSIGDAAQKLKNIQRNWCNYAFDFHRRSGLIAERLPHVSARPLKFPALPPSAPLGSWTLVENGLMLASPSCSSPMPNGAYVFEENKDDAPSRAYLKLWEALTRIGRRPREGELCIDLGACPGGWTWVLQGLGARVISVDKAPLDPRIAALPGVEYRGESAFGLDPLQMPAADWLFSDIICYPDRLLRLVQSWRAAGKARNFVCTIKFQGATDHAAVARFLEIPGSRAFHLYNNKHEITWVSLDDKTD